MSHTRIVVDNEVLFDGQLDQWAQRNPPDFIKQMAEQVKPGAISKPKVHMLAISLAFSEALARQADIVINVSTGPGWWTMESKDT